MSRESNLKPEKNGAFVRSVLHMAVLALILNLAIEWMARHSISGAFSYILLQPHAFGYNTLILASALSVAFLFRRRVFATVLVSLIWLTLGIINCVLYSLRITPLQFYDFVIFAQNVGIATAYLPLWQLILIGVGLLLIIGGLAVLFRLAPIAESMRKRGAALVMIVWAVTLILTVPYAIRCRDYSDSIRAYGTYGFPYSLLRSLVDRGVKKPDAYDQTAIQEILPETTEMPKTAAAKRPNIIFLQLESFLAPDNIISVTLSEDPVPTFSRLRESCSSGYLYVPTIGGGTANVEFEVLTGMRISDFGTGEYPYSTVLQETVCESVAYTLREIGYRAHAIHSNTATFYKRHLVYPRLGFDTFTPLEYMSEYETNDLGWCRDRYLLEPIRDALSLDEQSDLVFAVSVQGHGYYIKDDPQTAYTISSSGLEDNPGAKNAFEYYVSQLSETDAFLGDLLTELEEWPEPVILVVYGDHLPALDIPEENLKSGSTLATEYVIWSNDGSMKKEDRDLASYQLTAYVLERCGISGGILTSFHQQRWQDENYLQDLASLEYDMISGSQYLYEGREPYEPSDMKMGLKSIAVASAEYNGKAYIVRGRNFTPSSTVCIGDSRLNTIYVDESILVALPGSEDLKSGGEVQISVMQVAPDGTVLSEEGSALCAIK